MGQRLNIEIRKEDKVLANAYYHWFGYTSSSLQLTSEILKNIDNVNFDNDVAKAVKLLEVTGAGLTKSEFGFLSDDIKNIAFENEKPKTVMLEDGLIPWKKMIEVLGDKVKVLIEYPMDEEKIADQIETVKEAK